jgi:hypothetical protein
LGFQVAFQDEDGGYLIYYGAMFDSSATRGMEVTVGFGGGEALVPQVYWKAGFGAQHLREGLGFGGLGALISGHVEGIADHDLCAGVFADEALEGFEVLPAIAADKGEHGLGGETERVGNGDADATVSNVEAHDSGSWLVHVWMVQRTSRPESRAFGIRACLAMGFPVCPGGKKWTESGLGQRG